MVTLGVDTSTMAEGIGLAGKGILLDERNNHIRRTHSERLLSGIQGLLEQAGIDLTAIDGFAVTCGPGSFTGLRIGMATVQGLALACGRPVVGFSTLEAMAYWCTRSWRGWVCPMIDAGRGEVYAGLFRLEEGKVRRVREDTVVCPGAWADRLPANEKFLFVGDGAGRYQGLLVERRGMGHRVLPFHPFLGGTAALLGFQKFSEDSTAGKVALRPNYIRRPDLGRGSPVGNN
ncbi:MAG: tRNA (adenosine(37)-N6)-threonylcarbamoyltransferase complex dimerization subunit type 1 TsaB [Acidobacteria bacterium]|nr:tRNA (adenosine(37)-N6)-threonylcarbamoyltransferase complex dimerization subunit type 1 TsaB [Acidobacteriota bacterium]